MLLPTALIFVICCYRVCFCSLGKRFLVSFPLVDFFSDKIMVTVFTYYDDVLVQRNESTHYAALRWIQREDIILRRNRPFWIEVVYNTSLNTQLRIGVLSIYLQSTADFGVTVTYMGVRRSIAVMTAVPFEEFGSEYILYYLPNNQIMSVIVYPLPTARFTSFNFHQYTMSHRAYTFNQATSTRSFEFVYYCSNYEKVTDNPEAPPNHTFAGSINDIVNGYMGVVVGNCLVTIPRLDQPENCNPTPDDLLNMLMPTQFAAREFIVFNDRQIPDNRSFVALIGVSNSTLAILYQLETDPTYIALDRQSMKKAFLHSSSFVIVSTRPILAYLVFTSTCEGASAEPGGPSMASLIPTSLFCNFYIWSIPYRVFPVNTMDHRYVLLVKTNAVYNLNFNGQPLVLPVKDLQQVNGSKIWSMFQSSLKKPVLKFHFIYSTKNRPFGMYIYGFTLGLGKSYLTHISFQNIILYNPRMPFCEVTRMVVGDLIDNDCDTYTDEESSLTSDDDNDGQFGEDVIKPAPALTYVELDERTSVGTTVEQVETTAEIITTKETSWSKKVEMSSIESWSKKVEKSSVDDSDFTRKQGITTDIIRQHALLETKQNDALILIGALLVLLLLMIVILLTCMCCQNCCCRNNGNARA